MTTMTQPTLTLDKLAATVSLVIPITRTGVGHLPHPDPAVERNCDRLPDDLWRLHVADPTALGILHTLLKPLSQVGRIPTPGRRWWQRQRFTYVPVSPIRRVEHFYGDSWDGFVTLHPDQAANVWGRAVHTYWGEVPA